MAIFEKKYFNDGIWTVEESCEHEWNVINSPADDVYCSQHKKVCTKCGTVAEEQKVLHNLVTTPIEDDPEYESMSKCNNCGYTKYNEFV